MKFVLEVIDKSEMRYPTVGDWQEVETPDGTPFVRVQVADTGNSDYNFLVAVHELVEYYLCKRFGIREEEVSFFDETHPDSDEPGDENDAPYRAPHCLATGVERILAAALNVPWKDYDETLDKIYQELWAIRKSEDL